MASPQCENGFTRIANEIIEALVQQQIGDLARAILWIIRQTYGWGKKEAEGITAYAISRGTGMGYTQAKRVFKRLKEMGIVTDVGFQKDHDQWAHKCAYGYKSVPAPGGTQNRHRTVPPLTLIVKKEKKQSVGGHKNVPTEDAGFDLFWKSYPRKVGKGAARKSWKKIAPAKTLQDSILAALAIQKGSEAWARENGRYVPNPATWLNQGRWEDELPGAPRAAAKSKSCEHCWTKPRKDGSIYCEECQWVEAERKMQRTKGPQKADAGEVLKKLLEESE